MKKPGRELLVASLAVLGSLADNVLTPDKVEADITTEGLKETLQFLELIAAHNGGNRASGLPGYKDSAYWVHSQAAQYPELTVTLQPFNFTFEHTRNISLRGPDGSDVFVLSPQYNRPTPLPAGITAPLAFVNDTATAGARTCNATVWAAAGVRGRIALVPQRSCRFAAMGQAARDHGALAVLAFRSEPGRDYIASSVGGVADGVVLPALGLIPLEDGAAWAQRLAAGEALNATFVVDSVTGPVESWNVLAETRDGDPEQVVMLGAHLDSVVRGAGINDDGSGSAALLAIMASVRRYTGVRNKLRFAWWGAEEPGLLGSRAYTANLTEKERDRIRFYFNYDMIGSLRPRYFVGKSTLAGPVPDILAAYLQSQGKTPVFTTFSGGSDYDSFNAIGVPVSGIATGAAQEQDPCYHRPCDGTENINWEALTVISKAAGRAAAQLALSLEGVPPRNKTIAAPRTQRREWEEDSLPGEMGETPP